MLTSATPRGLGIYKPKLPVWGILWGDTAARRTLERAQEEWQRRREKTDREGNGLRCTLWENGWFAFQDRCRFSGTTPGTMECGGAEGTTAHGVIYERHL